MNKLQEKVNNELDSLMNECQGFKYYYVGSDTQGMSTKKYFGDDLKDMFSKMCGDNNINTDRAYDEMYEVTEDDSILKENIDYAELITDYSNFYYIAKNF